MSTEGERDEVMRRRLDWGLREAVGGERAPDVVRAVLARAAAGEVVDEAEVPPRTNRWLAAALILLGIGVVFAVALRERKDDKPIDAPTPVAPPQEPQPATVYSVADVDMLPADTRAVIARNCGDDVATALLRLRHLDDLEWHDSDREVYGLGMKVPPVDHPVLFHPGFRALCQLSKLRRLVLSGTAYARTAGPGTFMLLDELQKLPQLQELALRFFDVSDREFEDCFAVLPKLAALRRLDLSFNHGFGERGIAAVLQCAQLEALSVRGCQQLTPTALVRLGELPQLRELDVSLIDGMNWRNSLADQKDPNITSLLFGAQQTVRLTGAGVTDEALRGIARARTLKKLDLANSRFTDAGAAVLANLTQLEELDLGGNGIGDGVLDDLPPSLLKLTLCSDKLTDACCRKLRERLPKLRHLDISACYGIHDAGVADLVAIPTLRHLEIRQMYGLTAASIAHFLKATQLEQLDLRHCDFVTAKDVVALRRALPDLRELQTNVPDEEVQKLEELPPPAIVRSKVDIEALPANARNVEAIGIDDDAMPAFARLRELERLVITQDDGEGPRPTVAAEAGKLKTVMTGRQTSITDDSLRILGRLPNLGTLVLRGQDRLTGAGLRHLVDIPLQELDCDGVTTDGIACLPKLPRLQRLAVVHGEVSDEVVKSLAKCTRLRQLRLTARKWSGSLQPLTALSSLESLRLEHPASRDRFAWALGSPFPDGGAAASMQFPPANSFPPGERDLEALAKMHGLRRLELAGWRLLAPLDKLEGLDELVIDSCDLDDPGVARLPSTITSLELHRCERLTERFGAALAKAAPRLRSLDLSGSLTSLVSEAPAAAKALGVPFTVLPLSSVQVDIVCADLAHLTELRHLTLSTTAVSGEGLARLRALQHLETLDLTDMAALRVEDLWTLPRTLRKLDLRGCAGLGDRTGEAIAAAAPDLHTLDLSHCDGLTDRALAGLLQIHSLQQLDLSNCRGFTASAPAALAVAYVPGGIPTTTKLRTLVWRGRAFDAEALLMLRNLPSLQTLVTDAGTEQLSK